MATRDWALKGTIDLLRTTDDRRVVSYDVITDKGHRTTRHRRYLRPLHKDHDPNIQKTDTANDVTKVDDSISKEIADLPTKEQNAVSGEQLAPRRSVEDQLGCKGQLKHGCN